MRVLGGRSVAAAAVAGVIGLVAVLALAGCSGAATPTKSPVATGTSGAPTSTPTPTPTAPPTFDPNGDATANQYWLDYTGKHNWEGGTVKGAQVVSLLVKGGVPKSIIEITPDKTSIGLNAWNIEFSLKLKDTCLIGQAGNVGFHSFTGPVLATGKCLIGTTGPVP